MAPFRSGYAAIVGWPNVGKSTLLNTIVGTKLSIVAPQPQTTREAILGILNEPHAQLIFVDTPGWLSPKDNFQSLMKRAIVRSIFDDADMVLWLLEAKPFGADDRAFVASLQKSGRPVLVAVNKMDVGTSASVIDAIQKELAALLGEGFPFFKISAKSGLGVNELKNALLSRLPESPAYFPTDQLTDRWERFYVSELIREQIFKKYQQEVPHATMVLIKDFAEKPGRKDVIKADLIVESEGQKRILLGAGGRHIKQLGEAARKEIELRLGRPVFLQLVVKVHKNWRSDAEFLKKISTPA